MKNQTERKNLPLYLFHEGTNYKTYEYLGSHPAKRGRAEGAVFRVQRAYRLLGILIRGIVPKTP